MNFSGCARLVELARNVDADPASSGVLSTGEACAVARLLGRLDRLNDSYKYPLAGGAAQKSLTRRVSSSEEAPTIANGSLDGGLKCKSPECRSPTMSSLDRGSW
jgi:hypothetical protein